MEQPLYNITLSRNGKSKKNAKNYIKKLYKMCQETKDQSVKITAL